MASKSSLVRALLNKIVGTTGDTTVPKGRVEPSLIPPHIQRSREATMDADIAERERVMQQLFEEEIRQQALQDKHFRDQGFISEDDGSGLAPHERFEVDSPSNTPGPVQRPTPSSAVPSTLDEVKSNRQTLVEGGIQESDLPRPGSTRDLANQLDALGVDRELIRDTHKRQGNAGLLRLMREQEAKSSAIETPYEQTEEASKSPDLFKSRRTERLEALKAQQEAKSSPIDNNTLLDDMPQDVEATTRPQPTEADVPMSQAQVDALVERGAPENLLSNAIRELEAERVPSSPQAFPSDSPSRGLPPTENPVVLGQQPAPNPLPSREAKAAQAEEAIAIRQAKESGELQEWEVVGEIEDAYGQPTLGAVTVMARSEEEAMDKAIGVVGKKVEVDPFTYDQYTHEFQLSENFIYQARLKKAVDADRTPDPRSSPIDTPF